MVGEIMTLRFEPCIERSTFRIVTVDGKIDSFDVIDIDLSHKASYCRYEINKKLFERALYLAAKQNPERFKEIYKSLKKSDPEFFEIAKSVLVKIKAEYDLG